MRPYTSIAAVAILLSFGLGVLATAKGLPSKSFKPAPHAQQRLIVPHAQVKRIVKQYILARLRQQAFVNSFSRVRRRSFTYKVIMHKLHAVGKPAFSIIATGYKGWGKKRRKHSFTYATGYVDRHGFVYLQIGTRSPMRKVKGPYPLAKLLKQRKDARKKKNRFRLERMF
jgi:hypothetical protein